MIEVQILDKAVFISHSADTLGKSMNLIILSPVMVKILGQTRLCNFGMATCLWEGKLNSNLLNSALNWPCVMGWYIYIYIYIVHTKVSHVISEKYLVECVFVYNFACKFVTILCKHVHVSALSTV